MFRVGKMCINFILIAFSILFGGPVWLNLSHHLNCIILLKFFPLSCYRGYFSALSTLVCIYILLCLCMRESLTMMPKQKKQILHLFPLQEKRGRSKLRRSFLLYTRGWKGSIQGQSKKFSSGQWANQDKQRQCC